MWWLTTELWGKNRRGRVSIGYLTRIRKALATPRRCAADTNRSCGDSERQNGMALRGRVPSRSLSTNLHATEPARLRGMRIGGYSPCPGAVPTHGPAPATRVGGAVSVSTAPRFAMPGNQCASAWLGGAGQGFRALA